MKVSPLGEITVEAYGFRGSGCEAATKAIEEALGAKVSSRRKSDYWSQPLSHQSRQTLGGGDS
ncbi:MAG: DUF2997 domain-containing protein [Luteolibacter sp.]